MTRMGAAGGRPALRGLSMNEVHVVRRARTEHLEDAGSAKSSAIGATEDNEERSVRKPPDDGGLPGKAPYRHESEVLRPFRTRVRERECASGRECGPYEPVRSSDDEGRAGNALRRGGMPRYEKHFRRTTLARRPPTWTGWRSRTSTPGTRGP